MTNGNMTFMSRALGRHVTYSFILPDRETVGPGPYRVLVQLHGASDDHQAWLNRSNLLRHVQGLPLVVVMPDGALSSWIDHNPREQYGTFLNRDLREHVLATFWTGDDRWAIGGLSMGGYGALHNGLTHPEIYASVWAHSSACRSSDDMMQRPPHQRPSDVSAADLFRVAAELDHSTMPTLSFDCGTEDFLLEHNRRFHAHLEALGVPHHYAEHPGQHEWGYWDNHVHEALEQHARVLGISRRP